MMNVEFQICGGMIKINKLVFIREMLRPDSVMKRLLNYNLEDSGKTRRLGVDKSDSDVVTIDFNFADRVTVGEDYQNLLADLKREYGSNIRGEVVLASTYEFHDMYLNLDLGSDDGEIKLLR